MDYSDYLSPLSGRYASREMRSLFSQRKKFRTFRALWIALARAERALGLSITDEQIAEMERFKDDINFDIAEARERETRHDVMAHIYAYGRQCPLAAPIIHLGATSCFVGDNTDLIIQREALTLVRDKLCQAAENLARFAEKYKSLPCLGYTHLQPAQLTTVGKRASLWLAELLMDLGELDHRLDNIAFLGSKGATGTQASFLELFGGDDCKVKQLDSLIAREMGFGRVVPVSGQTYSRKQDYFQLSALSGVAQSASKFAGDLRVLQSFKEMEEPFEAQQVGSSAMPYKRNPMRCERISALTRYVMIDALNPALTASAQYFERTLDDSANKRLAVAEAFLATDGILNLLLSVTDGLVVREKVIASRVMAELPFMASENILMRAVAAGGDRQALHERLRVHAQAAGERVKGEGLPNDLLERVAADPAFGLDMEALSALLNPADYSGRSAAQVDDFLADEARPALARHADRARHEAEVRV